MWQGLRRIFMFGVVFGAAMAAVVPCASASITPTLSLDQSAGTKAGAVANLGVDLKFAPTSGDSPDEMTLNLPPGLLADASIDGGACLSTADLNDSACEVGSGTVTADAYGTIPITTPVTFDLVPPPAAGDLAGLAVNSSGTQVGATADIKVRPSGDPGGVGITIDFVLPNALYGVPISLAEISSTFDGLRYPTTCPSTPENFSVAANSYSDSTVHTVTAPLAVTGCSSLSYAPLFSVTAARDSGDKQVKLTTQITQTATQAPSRSLSLVFPQILEPNLAAVGVLCPTLSSKCTPVGSATAVSPLYPKPLTGQAYLTGSLGGLSLTLVFPSPFPLTLTGSVNLVSNATAFNGLPDIPLTQLDVSLYSGPSGLFQTTCHTPSGTATAVLTDQNGDKTLSVPSTFTVSGCPSTGGGSSGVGSPSGGGGGGGGGGGSGSSSGPTPSSPKLTDLRVSGLGTGHASLSFKVGVAKRAAKIRALTIELPSGMSFLRHRVRNQLGITGITLTGATVKSLSLSDGHLVITLRKAVSNLAVKINNGALQESATLKTKAKKPGNLLITVITENTNGQRTTLRVRIKYVGL